MSPLALIDLQIPPEAAAFVVFMGLVALVLLTGIIGLAWYKTQQVRLKDKMVERGYTAEEIVAVISASGTGRGLPCGTGPHLPASHPRPQPTQPS